MKSLLLMDWVKGKSSPETIDFSMNFKGLSGFNFPNKTNPLIDTLVMVVKQFHKPSSMINSC